jgi:hypothetical protein
MSVVAAVAATREDRLRALVERHPQLRVPLERMTRASELAYETAGKYADARSTVDFAPASLIGKYIRATDISKKDEAVLSIARDHIIDALLDIAEGK